MPCKLLIRFVLLDTDAASRRAVALAAQYSSVGASGGWQSGAAFRSGELCNDYST